MRLLASVRTRIFLSCWVVYSLFFATNIVREHYPAFTLIDQGDFKCDRYQGYHSDIFVHTDGHSYVGNNVLASVIAAVPLLVFDPLLDRIEERSQAQLAASPAPPDVTYDTPHPNRRDLFRRARLAGLDLRFGASAAITSVFLMAPLSALFVVLVYDFLARRRASRERAVWLAALFAFATPVFYRTAHLSHNMFLMEATFGAFLLLYKQPGERYEIGAVQRLLAGLLCGVTFALDYAGALPAAVLWAYFVLARKGTAGWVRALGESALLIVAALPPLAFLLWSQWVMYGDPFTPGQFVMRPVYYTEEGLKGITAPSLEVFVKNLVMPGWGLYAFAPLLLLGLVPAPRGARDADLVLPRRERWMAVALVLSFMLFCAMNRYSLMQFNTGFRYLLPIVPFVFLQACDGLVRVSRRTLAVLSVAAIAHMAALCMVRAVSDTEKELRDQSVALGVNELALDGYWERLLTETHVPVSWGTVLSSGPELPWLSVLAATKPGKPWLASPLLPAGLLLVTGALLAGLWRSGGTPAPAASPRAPKHLATPPR